MNGIEIKLGNTCSARRIANCIARRIANCNAVKCDKMKLVLSIDSECQFDSVKKFLHNFVLLLLKQNAKAKSVEAETTE